MDAASRVQPKQLIDDHKKFKYFFILWSRLAI